MLVKLTIAGLLLVTVTSLEIFQNEESKEEPMLQKRCFYKWLFGGRPKPAYPPITINLGLLNPPTSTVKPRKPLIDWNAIFSPPSSHVPSPVPPKVTPIPPQATATTTPPITTNIPSNLPPTPVQPSETAPAPSQAITPTPPLTSPNDSTNVPPIKPASPDAAVTDNTSSGPPAEDSSSSPTTPAPATSNESTTEAPPA